MCLCFMLLMMWNHGGSSIFRLDGVGANAESSLLGSPLESCRLPLIEETVGALTELLYWIFLDSLTISPKQNISSLDANGCSYCGFALVIAEKRMKLECNLRKGLSCPDVWFCNLYWDFWWLFCHIWVPYTDVLFTKNKCMHVLILSHNFVKFRCPRMHSTIWSFNFELRIVIFIPNIAD